MSVKPAVTSLLPSSSHIGRYGVSENISNFETQWQLYVPPGITLKICPQFPVRFTVFRETFPKKLTDLV
jgi:hypothetical protein